MFGCLFEKRSCSDRNSFFALPVSSLQLYHCPPLPAGKFFCFFQNCRPQTPFPSGNGWGLFKINILFKNFLGFKGGIWLFSVGISERIKNFLRFRVCIWLLSVGISEEVLQTAKYFLKQGWNWPLPSGNK